MVDHQLAHQHSIDLHDELAHQQEQERSEESSDSLSPRPVSFQFITNWHGEPAIIQTAGPP